MPPPDLEILYPNGQVEATLVYIWDGDKPVAWDGIAVGALAGIVDGANHNIEATVRNYTNANPLAVVLTDSNGDYASAGAGTQYTEDAAAPADPIGTVPILVRKDTPAATVTTDGDNIAQRGTNYGAAYVTLLDTSGNPVSVGGGTQYTEDAAAAADPVGTALVLVRKDTPTSEVTTDGDNIAARGNSAGAQYVEILAGTAKIGATSNALDINIKSGNPTSITANAGTNLNTSALALETGGNLAGAATSLAVIDDWDESDRAKVNPIAGQAGVQGGSGVVTALTQRVVLATDVALPAGTNAIGKLAANDGVDIGNVDVASVAGNVTVIQGTATNLKAQAEVYQGGTAVSSNNPLYVIGKATLSDAQANPTEVLPVASFSQIYNGSTNDRLRAVNATLNQSAGTSGIQAVGLTAQFDDTSPQAITENNWGNLRISSRREVYAQIRDAAGNERGLNIDANGAVTVAQGTASNLKVEAAIASAQTLATVTTVGAVTAITNALPAGTNNIGDVDILSIAAGDNNIGNVDVVSLPATPAGTNFIGHVGHGQTPLSVTGSAAATATVVAAVSAKKTKVYSLSLMTTSTNAMTITFKDGAAGTALATYLLQSPTSIVTGISEGIPIPSTLFQTTANTLLEMAISGTGTIYYNIRYWNEA